MKGKYIENYIVKTIVKQIIKDTRKQSNRKSNKKSKRTYDSAVHCTSTYFRFMSLTVPLVYFVPLLKYIGTYNVYFKSQCSLDIWTEVLRVVFFV